MYYDRKTKAIVEEIEYQKQLLKFLYQTKIGRVLLKTFIARPWFSKLRGLYQRSVFSKKDILPFIDKYQIDIDKEYAKSHYKNFNDFFIRNKILDVNYKENDLVSPADSKMQIFDITPDLTIRVKRSLYNVEDLLQDETMAAQYSGGKCVVFRLSVDDYHRYHFIDNGQIVYNKKIKGELHTVRPISEKYNVFTRNAREVTIINTEHLGQIAYIEVGALLVGKINNHDKVECKKYEEKGYFEFGGSTIILLLNKKIKFDSDIIEANNLGYEVKVCAGEPIGQIEE